VVIEKIGQIKREEPKLIRRSKKSGIKSSTTPNEQISTFSSGSYFKDL